MTWNRRKATELIRLLKEYKRESVEKAREQYEAGKRELSRYTDRELADMGITRSLSDPGPDPLGIDILITSIKMNEGDWRDFGGRGPGDRESLGMLMRLRWWCDVVRDRYGMKRHTAITWLMQQYYDKEGNQTFRHKWGASVDSAARRLVQKVKYLEAVEPRHDKEQYAATLKEGVDIYHLTFKVLKFWPEPGSCRK